MTDVCGSSLVKYRLLLRVAALDRASIALVLRTALETAFRPREVHCVALRTTPLTRHDPPVPVKAMRMALAVPPNTWRSTNPPCQSLWLGRSPSTSLHRPGRLSAEQKIVTGNLIRLRATIKQDAIRTVQRLHRNLGHPGPAELAKLLETRGASEAVIQAAKSYVAGTACTWQKPGRCCTSVHARYGDLQPDHPGRRVLAASRQGQVPDSQHRGSGNTIHCCASASK